MVENQDLLKILQQNQQSNRWLIVSSLIPHLIYGIGYLISVRQKKKPNLALQLLEKREKLAKLELEIETLKKQAKYNLQRTEFEAGLKGEEIKDLEVPLGENTNFKEKGESLVKKGFNSLVNKLKKKE